jgi:hypothetical protein
MMENSDQNQDYSNNKIPRERIRIALSDMMALPCLPSIAWVKFNN